MFQFFASGVADDRCRKGIIQPRWAGYTVTGVLFMKKSISTWQMVGFVFTGVLGTLLHFVFDWTDGSMIAAVFSAVNESIWEHIKLLIYPMLLFALVEYKVWGREVTCFWQVKLFGLLAGIVLIPGLYYTYTGILGKSADWFNITIFFIVAAAVYYMETKLLQKESHCHISNRLVGMLVILLPVVFTLLTFYPPHIPLFQDPVTYTYGFFET